MQKGEEGEGGEGQRGEGLQHFLAAGRILQATVATPKEVRSRQRDHSNLPRARFPTGNRGLHLTDSASRDLNVNPTQKKLLTEHALGTEHKHGCQMNVQQVGRN